MDRLSKRLAVIEAKQPKPKRVTFDDLHHWYRSQFVLGHLQRIDGTVIVNPALETSPLHSRVLAALARAAGQAKAAKEAKLGGKYG